MVMARLGVAWRGVAGLGVAVKAWRGEAGRGRSRRGGQGKARQGAARRGVAVTGNRKEFDSGAFPESPKRSRGLAPQLGELLWQRQKEFWKRSKSIL